METCKGSHEQKRRELEIDLNANDVEVKYSDFYILKGVLGKGAFGHVTHAIDKQTKEEIAVKVY